MDVGTALLGVAGIALLLGGAELLVRSGSRVAARLGLPPIVVGLTIVSIGTSLPELAVGVDAARSGAPDIATGNILGTNLVNLLFVLGLAALVRPVPFDRATLRVDLPAMVAATLLLLVLALDGELGPVDGVLLLAAAVGYLALVFWSRPREEVADGDTAGDGSGEGAGTRDLLLQLALLAVSIALVLLGARWLVDAATAGALALGVSQAVIGLTVVAIGTSAPELATMLVALARGRPGLAVGNLVGSSVFNIALVLGATTVLAPGARVPMDPDVLGADLVLLVAATLVTALAMLTGRRLSRVEGAVLVLGYVAYLTWLLLLRV